MPIFDNEGVEPFLKIAKRWRFWIAFEISFVEDGRSSGYGKVAATGCSSEEQTIDSERERKK